MKSNKKYNSWYIPGKFFNRDYLNLYKKFLTIEGLSLRSEKIAHLCDIDLSLAILSVSYTNPPFGDTFNILILLLFQIYLEQTLTSHQAY